MSERGDVDADLAAMDDKLRELQRELSVLTVAPEAEDSRSQEVAGDEALVGGESPESEVRNVLEIEATARPEADRIGAPEPERVTVRALRAAPAPDRAKLPLAAVAADQARAIIADAETEAARIVDEAAHRVTAMASQIDDLQRLCQELERSARALVDDYAAALAHVERAPPARPEPLREPRSDSPRSAVHPPLW